MKYTVTVNGQDVEVTVDGSIVRVGETEAAVQFVELEGTPLRVVTISGHVHRVLARRGVESGRYTIHLDGYRFDVEALDERTRAVRRLAGSAARPAGQTSLAAPMPGLVMRVLVRPGDRVQPGQGLVVIEAMKMENELRAAVAGVVRGVTVTAGSAVEKGAVLVEFEPVASPDVPGSVDSI